MWRAVAVWVLAGCACVAQTQGVAPDAAVSGVVRVAGSPQMGELLRLWEAGFAAKHSGVRFEDDLKSTVTAVSAVAGGQADVSLLGREIWPEEVRAYVAARGHEPRVMEVATGSYDVPKATFALMVFVPRENPIGSLSMAQLARIFSAERPVRRWGELGLTGAWAERPIHLYGFERENDKSRIFVQLVFAAGAEWSAGLRSFGNLPDGTDAGQRIVDAVGADADGIGISNVHYATGAVRMVAVSAGAGAAVAPSRAAVASRVYPLSRAVYVVLDRDASAAAVEFVEFMRSGEGQRAVEREGNYLPLPPGGD